MKAAWLISLTLINNFSSKIMKESNNTLSPFTNLSPFYFYCYVFQLIYILNLTKHNCHWFKHLYSFRLTFLLFLELFVLSCNTMSPCRIIFLLLSKIFLVFLSLCAGLLAMNFLSFYLFEKYLLFISKSFLKEHLKRDVKIMFLINIFTDYRIFSFSFIEMLLVYSIV